jgi:ankyrin repeat protein
MRGASRDTFALHDAQLVLARAHGFASWPKLKAHVEGVTLQRAAEAVRAGDVDEVRRLLDARPELVHIEMADNNEHRLLHYAVLARNASMTRLLMQYGANPHQGIYPHRDATTALTIAVDRGFDDIAGVIRDEEKNRRPTVRGGNAPDIDQAIQAMGRGDRGPAKALVERHPELIDARHPDGWTLLHCASAMLDHKSVEWLIERGADVNARGDSDRTPLDVAAELRRDGSPKKFKKIAKILLRAGAYVTPASAVALGDVEWLRNRHAESPLTDAVRYSMVGSMTGLLTIAAQHDRVESVKLLLELGLDPNERTRLENVDNPTYSAGMPLRHCAVTGNLAIAKVLLDAGADPNVHVYASGSAMYVAYEKDNAPMVALLAQYGGVPDAITVALKGHVDVARRMLDDAAAGITPVGVLSGESVANDLLWGGAGTGKVAMVRLSLEHIDWPRDDLRWYGMLREPLYIGLRRSKKERDAMIECFRLILDRADASKQGDGHGRTPLHDLSTGRHEMPDDDRVTLATMLLDAGARLDVRDEMLKSTPLGWACRWGRVDLVELLLARGADPVDADAEPWATPRAWASKRGHSKIVELLDRSIAGR